MNKLNRLGVLAAIFIFCMLALSFNGYSTDDAYISYRYAQNLATGHGLVFNIDQVPVEGYTNFLWTILLAAIGFVRLPIPATAEFLGIIAALLLLILTGVWANRQRIFTTRFSGSIPMLLLACVPSIALWSTSGMETLMFTMLLIAGTVLISIEERKEWIGIMSGLLFAFAALTRPEGILIGFLIIVLSFIEGREWSMRFAFFIVRLGLFLLPPVLHIIWRKSYYGHWFPNTFYAKTSAGSELIGAGLSYLQGFLLQGGLILLLLTALGIFIRPRIEGIWTILITSTIYVAYVVWVGGDWMPANRMFVPIIPFLVMGASAFIVKSYDASPRFSAILASALCGYLLISGIIAQKPFIRHSFLAQRVWNDEPQVDVLKELGLYLHETASPYDLLATVSAGKIPYYSGLRTIDMRGLCDAHIARQPVPAEIGHQLPGHLRRDPEYVLSREPDYIVLSGAIRKSTAPKPDLTERGDSQVLDEWSILKIPEFIRHYEEVRIPLPDGEKDMLFYKRKTSDSGQSPLLKFPEGTSEDQIIDRLAPGKEPAATAP